MEKVEKKATSIESEHISQLTCAGCQKVLDVSHLNPFTTIKCPECGMEQIVPAKFGGFLLVKQLGAGGMGVIYRAVDRELGRQVALKVMKKSLGDNPEFYKSFKHEAQAAAALNHRNVVQIYSFGQYNGQPYIVMELVAGGKLDDLSAGTGNIDELKALEIHLEVAEGLMAASDVGLVHGDVKPANILFGKSGEAKVVDFGLASYIGDQKQGGQVWGTPYYIAPEKARGKKADFRSDIYSLGATLFHVLTGKPPFDGPTSNDVVMARLNQPAPNILDVNPNLHQETAQMVARMLETDPAMRYPSYPALLIDMRNAINAARKPLGRTSHISVAIPIKASEKKVKSLLKKINVKMAAGIAGGVVLAVLVVAGLAFNHLRQERVRQAADDRKLFETSRSSGRAARDRIVNLWALIAPTGSNLMAYAVRADKMAAAISRVDDANALLMDETDKVKDWYGEAEDLQANSVLLVQQLDAASDAKTAKRLNDGLQAAFNRLVAINISLNETSEIIKEIIKEADARHRLAMEEVNRINAGKAKIAADKAKIAADRRKAEEEQKQAKKKEEELQKMRPAIVQKELDLVEKYRGANAVLISQKRFEEAERSFATVQARMTLDETRAACKNIMEAYGEIAKLKSWLINAINAAPYKNGWQMGSSRSDITKASNENGITVTVGETGSTVVQWESITVSQLLKMINYYVDSMGLTDGPRAEIFKQAALFCYESGVFKTAETYAGAAYKASPEIKADLNRLMPDILSPE